MTSDLYRLRLRDRDATADDLAAFDCVVHVAQPTVTRFVDGTSKPVFTAYCDDGSVWHLGMESDAAIRRQADAGRYLDRMTWFPVFPKCDRDPANPATWSAPDRRA